MLASVAMDSTWAVIHLRMFADMIDPGRGPLGPVPPLPDDAVLPEAAVIESILDEVTPDWRTTVPAFSVHRWGQHREAARRAMTVLLCAAEQRAQASLEQPAAVGVVARWVDDARALTAS
jgi:hypothetical protein